MQNVGIKPWLSNNTLMIIEDCFMISKRNYTSEHLNNIVKRYGGDIAVFERVLFAFGLLQSLVDVNLNFIFKGGTCLLLLLEHPKRFSTDIDIVVDKDADIDQFIQAAGKLFPFKSCTEQIRKSNHGIVKRHYKFEYDSILTNSPATVILDVVFENNTFIKTKEVEISSPILLMEAPISYVKVPVIDYLIADKLTAFAPTTVGVLYNVRGDLEIIKQMHDVAVLFDYIDDISIVKSAYKKYAYYQIRYRNLTITHNECLDDTIGACLSILSEGSHSKHIQSYSNLKSGIQRIKNHIFGGYNYVDAILHASKVLLLATVIRYNHEWLMVDIEKKEPLIQKKSIYANLNRISKINRNAFNYIKASILILDT